MKLSYFKLIKLMIKHCKYQRLILFQSFQTSRRRDEEHVGGEKPATRARTSSGNGSTSIGDQVNAKVVRRER
jgi:hypothetical protein